MQALSAQIWEGQDYVPGSFDDWVADRRGRFMVAYGGDQLAGFNKLTELAPGQWWLEGLRVDPAQRGRGLARLLHENGVRLAEEIGTGRLPAVESFLDHSTHALACGGLLEDEWAWYEIRPFLAELQAGERLYWWRRPGGAPPGLVIANRPEPGLFWLNYADVAPGDWPALAAALPCLAARLGCQRLEGKPLASETVLTALLAAGWQIDPDVQMWLLEREL